MALKLHASGVTVTVKLTPNARKSAFGGQVDAGDGKTALKVSINAAPEDGRANKALFHFLAERWELPKSSFSLLSGHSSRLKVVLIEGDGPKLMEKLSQRIADAL